MDIHYLDHSGFSVALGDKILVFDYYRDPAGIVKTYTKGQAPLWFFVSHNHGDHFNRYIADFHGAQYIYNEDVPFRGAAPDAMHSMKVYDIIEIGNTKITQYGSTDEGGSFLVESDGTSIFHAGDLNWWHWLGDTDENNREAKGFFDREMKRLDGLSVDVAFFPVDARLESAREWGVTGFLCHVSVKRLLIPMHYFGAPWTPSEAFQKEFPQVPLWIPKKPGDHTKL